MPDIPAPAVSFLTGAEPQLFVTDIAAALAFYSAKLGFEVRFAYGEPAFYAGIARNEARLNLRHVDRLPFDAKALANEDLLSATITVEAIESLFREYEKAGVTFHQSLRTEPWGARTFIVCDPDGNLICFAGGENG
jgi:catechol 2,3-dioxygenase-like lactoylglutathione lyase family enzyme